MTLGAGALEAGWDGSTVDGCNHGNNVSINHPRKYPAF